MRKQFLLNKSAEIFLFAVLILSCFSCQAKNRNDHIIRVFVPKNKPGTVLFDTELQPSQILVQDSESVFFVMGTSPDNEWVELSKMPADPDEASGTNEEKLLLYVPQKRVVFHPEYGDNAPLIGIDVSDDGNNVLWDVDGRTDTVSIAKLKSLYRDTPKACPVDTPAVNEKHSVRK